METLEVGDGVRLVLERFGSGPRTLLVPTAGNAADFSPLADAGLTVVCCDARGRGRSDPIDDPRRLGLGVDVADLDKVQAHLASERISVLATGYFAGVGVHFAAARPERVDRLVLAGALTPTAPRVQRPAPPPAPHLLARLDQLEADGLPDRDPEAFCREWRAVYIPQLLADPTSYERFVADPCTCANERPDRVARTMAGLFLDLGEWDWREVARSVGAPTLVVHGALDSVPVDEMAEWVDVLPVARLWVVEGAARFPWVERGPDFAETVRGFLDGRWPDDAS